MHFCGTRSALGLVPGSDSQKALGVHAKGPCFCPPREGAQGILQSPARGVPKFWSCLWVGPRHWREEELMIPGAGQVAPVPQNPPAASQGSGVPLPLPSPLAVCPRLG